MRSRLSRLLRGSALNRVTVAMIFALLGLEIVDAPRIWVLACGALGLVAWLLARWPEQERHEETREERAVPAPAGTFPAPPGADAALWNAVAESLPALVWVLDPEGLIVEANRRGLDYVGAASKVRIALSSVIHEAERGGFEALRQPSDREFRIQARLRRQDGAYRWHTLVGAAFEPGGWLVCAVDIEPLKIAQESQFRRNVTLRTRVAETAERLQTETTARARTERQLRHTQKMDALSRLAGGIAHDLNNKLIVIGANIDAVVKHLKDAPQARRKLLSALVASDQAAELMSKLLAFARPHDQKPRYIDVAEHLHSVCGLLERSFLSDSVRVRLDMPNEPWALEVDPQAFETAIVNLAVNARDAMEEGGTILIEAGNVTVPGGRREGDLAGDFVRITVSDSGRGILPEHLDRVFEPFFTTKEASRFSGLGLSQVQSFAEGLGGTADIASTPGQGTAVSLLLPKAELRARIGAPPAFDDLIEDEDEVRPGADILVVDDEVEVALAIQGMLTELGYEPRVAIGAEEAMAEIAAARPALVLTDVTMPGLMDGVALGRAVREAYPGIPVVLITGNPTVVAGDSEFPLIPKPIASRALNAALQRHLSADAPGNVVPLFTGARRKAGGP